MNSLIFDSFKIEYANAFERLNINWLEEYFYVEPYDRQVLANPQKYILDGGGHIFAALLNGQVVGVLALMPVPGKEKVYELTKMAVATEYRGRKIGQKLLTYSLKKAREAGIHKLILYSNRKLQNAIYLYRKFGFSEISLEEPNPYKRANIKMNLLITNDDEI